MAPLSIGGRPWLPSSNLHVTAITSVLHAFELNYFAKLLALAHSRAVRVAHHRDSWGQDPPSITTRSGKGRVDPASFAYRAAYKGGQNIF